jgi:hypothetical protein
VTLPSSNFELAAAARLRCNAVCNSCGHYACCPTAFPVCKCCKQCCKQDCGCSSDGNRCNACSGSMGTIFIVIAVVLVVGAVGSCLAYVCRQRRIARARAWQAATRPGNTGGTVDGVSGGVELTSPVAAYANPVTGGNNRSTTTPSSAYTTYPPPVSTTKTGMASPQLAYPPPAYPPPAYPPPAYPPPAYPPSAYPPPAYPSTARPAVAYPPTSYPPTA